MTRIRLRQEVERALHTEWNAFAERHPNLAAVLDEERMVEQAVRSLDENDEYQHAMAEATAARLGGEVLGGIVLEFVRRWLRRLV